MFITKKKFEEALELERKKAYEETDRWNARRYQDERMERLERDVAKLKENVYNRPKRLFERKNVRPKWE